MSDKMTLITIGEALASKKARSRSWIYRRLKAGEIQAKKDGRRTLLVEESLQAREASLPDYAPLSKRRAVR